MSTSDGRVKLKFVCFFIGGREYAVPAEEAMEITRWRGITRLPGAPSYIKGIVSLGEEMVPVVDLAMRLGLDSSPGAHGGTYLVAGTQGSRAVLIVERVAGIRSFDAASIRPDKKKKFVTGVIRDARRVIRIINIEGILDIRRRD